MAEKYKYCPRCGKKQVEGNEVCENCGYNFHTKKKEENEDLSKENVKEEKITKETSSDEKLNKEDYKKKTTDTLDELKTQSKKAVGKVESTLKEKNIDKSLIIKIAVALLVLIAGFFYFTQTDIAGEYYHEDSDDLIIDISRRGKAKVFEGDESGMNVSFAFDLKEMKREDKKIYYPDYSDGYEVEISYPEYLFADYRDIEIELNRIVEMTGLKMKNKKGMQTISGKISRDDEYMLEAIDIGIDDIGLNTIETLSGTSNILVNESDVFIKR